VDAAALIAAICEGGFRRRGIDLLPTENEICELVHGCTAKMERLHRLFSKGNVFPFIAHR
jgi:hypothetical protein